MRYMILYEKTGCMKFVGHLDLLRFMQRALRRAGIDAAYSRGFNPRSLVSFAAPLSVGVSGLFEIMTIRVNSEVDGIDERLNAQMPPLGLAVLGGRVMEETEKEPASVLRYADFSVSSPSFSEELLAEVMSENENIHDLKHTDRNTLFMRLSQGSTANLKPSAVLQTLCGRAGVACGDASYTRLKLYKADGAEIF
ncbi:hypothetical protein FACS1894188_01910 [Clostridia bacterium]|nr:hypothetical protein FACS1894188_01910 [Clostridia bacterium]